MFIASLFHSRFSGKGFTTLKCYFQAHGQGQTDQVVKRMDDLKEQAFALAEKLSPRGKKFTSYFILV